MYFAIDFDNGETFEKNTLKEVITELQGYGWSDSEIQNRLGSEIEIFKGTRVKLQYTPSQFTEVVEKKTVAKKPAAKKTGGKR